LLVSLSVACWLGFTRLGRRLVEVLPGPWWVQVVLAVTAVTLVGRLVTLPFGLLLHDHRVGYGLSTQDVAGYLADVARSEAVGIVVTTLVLLVVIGCARRWRRVWPAVAGGVLAVLVMVGSFAYPVLVEPVFNDFDSLPPGPLRTEILALADRVGVDVEDVLVVDASRRTTTLNAYVSGLGSTRRVVVYDNLVDAAPQDQALSVVAHELAHARHQDVLVGTTLGALGAAAGVGLLALAVGAWGRRHGLSMADPAVVPLALALVAIGGLLVSPVQSTISRHIELRADVDALQVTDDPDAFIAVQKKLAARSLSDPTRRSCHTSGSAVTRRPWSGSESPSRSGRTDGLSRNMG
jgi:STE24 endopeptidase